MGKAAAGQSQTRQLVGEIKLWFPRKHFGFIMPDNKPEDEPDIFFHGTHVENRKDMPIKRFARVKFSVIPAPKGPQARDVTITAYQPDKEQAADEAEAQKQAESGKPTRRDEPRSKKKKKRTSDSRDGPRGSQFRREINIEDSLDHVSPTNLGFDPMNGAPMTRHPSTRNAKGMSRSTSAPKSRRSALTGSIQNIRASRKAQTYPGKASSTSPRAAKRTSNRDAHRNWGSISSELGSMRWDDSIRSVSELFARSSNGPDAANRPKMSIQGSGPDRRSRDNLLRSSMRTTNAAEILKQILARAQAAADYQ